MRINRPVSAFDTRALGAVLLGLGVAAAAGAIERGRTSAQPPKRLRSGLAQGKRQLNAASALLAGAVLADSAIEHYRGAYQNPAMYTPLAVSSLAILASVEGALGGGRRTRVFRDVAYAAAGTAGAVGLGFHLYNIGKRPGGYNWLNLFYAAPFGAPAALSLAGLIGYAAERLGETPSAGRLFGLPFAPALAGVTSFGLAGTVAEVAMLHFRGAFQNPFMWLPVSLPPVASALIGKAAVAPGRGRSWFTRAWLWTTAVLGIGGVGFHAYGISRAMGGWRNWSQNVLDGPPLPAPPSFSALALAGLAALDLIERRGAGAGR